MSAQRPTLKQLKRTPLTVLPCENNCAEERCEHYRDCQSLVLMTQYLIDINVDPALLAEVERGRDRTLENWTKKGILRGCMFKVPHATKDDAQHHVNVLKQGDPNNNYFWYPCRYSPEDKTHYHVAHSNASIGSLIRSGRGKKYAHYVENQ